jgi:hypothetical protein
LFFWWWERCGDASSIGDGDGVATGRGTFAMASPPETVGKAAGDTAGPSLSRYLPRAPQARLARHEPTCPRKRFVRQWLLSNGEYDHSAAAEDEHASLLAAGAWQRLPTTNKAGPVNTDQAARWALGAIPALLPNAIQKPSVPRWTNMMAEAAKAPDDEKPSQKALERLLHKGLVSATVVACWDGACAKLAGGGAEARRLSA